MRRLLGTLAILIAAVAVGLGITMAIHHRQTSGGPPLDPTTTPSGGATTKVPVDIVPAAGQTFVTGTVSVLSADNAVGPPLTPPFTITIPVRGAGSADLTGVSVAGQNVEIYWYGGQPLPVSGTGQLAIAGGAVTVNSGGTTWMLDGATRSLSAGQYHLGAPVAVGSSGLATPYQNISFIAGTRTTMLTRGKAQIHVAPASLHLTGPGSVTLHGSFELQTAAGQSHVQMVVFGSGSYDITLTPVAGGDTIKAIFEGRISSA